MTGIEVYRSDDDRYGPGQPCQYEDGRRENWSGPMSIIDDFAAIRSRLRDIASEPPEKPECQHYEGGGWRC
jgi:hypothetical protein